MKNRKGRGARKSRKSQNEPQIDDIECVADLVRRAQIFYQGFGGGDTECLWGAQEATPGTWIAFPMGAEPHCLTCPITRVAHKVSDFGAGLVCTAMAVVYYKEMTKNREVIAVLDDAIERLYEIVDTHPESEQILAIAGMVA
jgi:hypothetical protein